MDHHGAGLIILVLGQQAFCLEYFLSKYYFYRVEILFEINGKIKTKLRKRL